MGQWVELALRKEQFDLIVESLESKCCESEDYSEIERYVWIIEDLLKQEEEYNRKLCSLSDIGL